MIENPNVLDKAQQELDQVCGVFRSPSSKDIKGLPYLRAAMTEVCNKIKISFPGILDFAFVTDRCIQDLAMASRCARGRASSFDPRRLV